MRSRLILAAFGMLAGSPALASECSEVMTLENGIQAKFCVSSVLKPQGKNTYGPENLRLSDDKSWCEGVAGEGTGEWLTISFPFKDVTVKKITITNGYGKTAKSFAENSTAKRIELTTKEGVKESRLNLPDTAEPETWVFDKSFTTSEIRLTITDVYGKKKFQDTCVNAISVTAE